jgi:predicted RNase H-like HicB family nuclease
MAKYRYPIVIEKAEHNYSAYLPDIDGCVTTGQTPEEVVKNMQEALRLHLSSMLEDGDPLPPPSTVDYVEVEILQVKAS